ncbi:MAG: aminoacyl-tRNA hydrolase [bacterium]
MTYLVAFLGNPGKQYEKTRHNVAWRLLEPVRRYWMPRWQQKFRGRFAQVTLGSGAAAGNAAQPGTAILLVPETYMNKSGESVQPCARYFRIPDAQIIVVHDDTELDFGAVAMKFGGGLGGNNGLKSVAERLGTRDFFRLRIGVSRPRHGSLSSHVLGAFTPEEESTLPPVVDHAFDLLERSVRDGVAVTGNIGP